MDNLYYYNQGREVPDTAKKPIQGGRMNGKTDINPAESAGTTNLSGNGWRLMRKP